MRLTGPFIHDCSSCLILDDMSNRAYSCKTQGTGSVQNLRIRSIKCDLEGSR